MTTISKRICFLIALTVHLAAVTVSAEPEVDAELDGLTIVEIEVIRHDLFDTSNPKTSSWPYRWANALNIVSKEGFIRSMLLFKEGDPYSASAAAESGRMLRDLGIMNPVDITAVRVEDGVKVTVETRDQWTLKVGAKLGIFGNRTDLRVDFEEENLAGWGKAFSIAYERDHERDSFSVGYFDPNVFKSRWRVSLLYADLSDGFTQDIVIDRPFYSLQTPWTWGAAGLRQELIDYLYSQSVSVVQGLHRTERASIWGGARLPGGGITTRRLVGGWEYREHLYSDWVLEESGEPYPPPEDRLISGPRISYEQVADRFEVVTGFKSWAVQEDVAFGPNFSLTAVFSAPTFGGDRRRVLTAGRVHGAKQRGQWLIFGDGWFSGRIEDGEARNLVAGLQLAAGQLGTSGFQTRLLVEGSSYLDRDRQLTLGADLGLRGWDPDYFDGTGRAILNLQWRRLIKKDVLGFFSVGIVLFGDAGKTWNPRVGPDTDGIRFDAGVGLLFDVTQIGRNALLRVDAAVPDDGSGITFTVSTSTIFDLPERWW